MAEYVNPSYREPSWEDDTEKDIIIEGPFDPEQDSDNEEKEQG